MGKKKTMHTSTGKNKRNTATRRNKKFKREVRSLGRSVAGAKRSRGAGRSGKPEASVFGSNKSKSKKPIEQTLSDVASSSSAAICDSLDAKSLLDMMIVKRPDQQQQQQQQPSSSTSAAAPQEGQQKQQQQQQQQQQHSSSSSKGRAVVSSSSNNRKYAVGTVRNDLDASCLAEISAHTKRIEVEPEQRNAADDDEEDEKNNKNRYARVGLAHEFWGDGYLNLVQPLRQALAELKFSHPTPVQHKVLPSVLAQINADSNSSSSSIEKKDAAGQQQQKKKSAGALRRDLVVSSETGSGKTLLFAIPSLQHLLLSSPPLAEDQQQKKQKQQQKPNAKGGINKSAAAAAADSTAATRRGRDTEEIAVTFEEWDRNRVLHTLVLTPTRELAEQIHTVYCSLAKHCSRRQVTASCVLGGMSVQKQQRVVNRRPHILICTPGRVWDLVKRNEGCYLGHSVSRRLSFLVLDEADRLLQSGRFEDLRYILERIHCEILPSGMIVGGTASSSDSRRTILADGEVVEGKVKPLKRKKKKKSNNDDDDDDDANGKDEEEAVESDQATDDDDDDDDGEAGALVAGTWDPIKNKFVPLATKNKKKKKKQQQSSKQEEQEGGNDDFDEAAEDIHDDDDADEQQQQQKSSSIYNQKDFIRPMPTPPPPPQSHRPSTIVTSATLTLQANYSHRNFGSKHYLQTTNVNMLARVLQDLGIREKFCDVHNCDAVSLERDMIQAGKESNMKVIAADNAGADNRRKPGGNAAGVSVAAKLHEAYTRCPQGSKDLYLLYFLRVVAGTNDRTIVFVNAISMLRRIYALLAILGLRVGRLHSSMPQRSRMGFIDRFRSGEINILVATDVAARGLDVDGVKYVVHLQAPRSTDGYIHRCGRTARCGGTGFSLMLVAPEEFAAFKQLLKSMGRAVADVEVFQPEESSRQMKELHECLKVAEQVDRLEREVAKASKEQHWVQSQITENKLDRDIDDEFEGWDEDDDHDNADDDDAGFADDKDALGRQRRTKKKYQDGSDMLRDGKAMEQEHREKIKAAKLLRKRLTAMMREMAGRGQGGRGAFLSTPRAIGAQEAMQRIRERTKRQLYLK